MNPASTPAEPLNAADASALRQCVRILAPVAMVTALADYVFWDGRLGASVGVFFAGLGAIILAQHRGRPRLLTAVLALLLVATCVQCAIELSLSSAVLAVTLSIALAGQVFQPQLGAFWARFSEALHGLLNAPRHWVMVSALAARGAGTLRAKENQWSGPAAFALQALLPAVVLLLVFGAVFASGHAVFGNLLQRANDTVFALWENLNVTPLRVLWWIMVATLALGLFHRVAAPAEPRWWTRQLPRIPRRDARLARWQTAAALIAMNALFCMVNTLEALFVWGDSPLPAGVGHAEFVHAGVNSLITAVVLSAVVIAGMFQQREDATNSRWLKHLAGLWVLQNFILIAGVFRRLMLYAEAYQLTERRVYVACFLALVSAGFFLLARFVQKGKSLNWLVWSNVLATLALFFTLQFVNVAGAVAQYNVARLEEDRGIDVEYLYTLGPAAWPELIRVAENRRDPAAARQAQNYLSHIAATELPSDWRAFQWREWKNHQLVLARSTAR